MVSSSLPTKGLCPPAGPRRTGILSVGYISAFPAPSTVPSSQETLRKPSTPPHIQRGDQLARRPHSLAPTPLPSAAASGLSWGRSRTHWPQGTLVSQGEAHLPHTGREA